MTKRVPQNPVYNRLAFNGYHIQGEYYFIGGSGRDEWEPFHDHYLTIEKYSGCFEPVGSGVFSPREIYLQQLEDGLYRNIVIRDNDDIVLWDDAKELDFLANNP